MRTSILLSSIACSVALAAGSARAGAPQDTVSPSDAKIIVEAAADFMKDCGGCVAPGFDFKAKTVKVSADDLTQRDKWINDVLDENGGSAHDGYARTLTQCELKAPPKIVVDVAVVKFWQVNQLAPPVQNIFDSLWAACGNPPNAAIKAFVHKVKLVHVTVARPWPKGCPSGSCGYAYSFDAKTGTLTVGAHNHPVNLDDEALKWLKKQ